jgi:hypothetical protein
VSVVCLADSKPRTGSCRGHPRRWWVRRPWAGAHGDHLLVGALVGQEHALAPLGGTCHRGALMPPPLVLRACPGQTGGIVPHSGQAAYWVIKGDSKLTLQFGNIRRSCRSGRTHRRKGHGALLHESWILWRLPRESESGSPLACVHQERTVHPARRWSARDRGCPQCTANMWPQCGPPPLRCPVPRPVRPRTTLSSVAMSQMPDRRGWLEFSRPAFKLRLLYPPVTPGGRPVDITEEQHDGAHRVHLTAREGGEIYLEFFRLPDLQPPDEYAGHPGVSGGAVRPRGRQPADGNKPAEMACLVIRVSRERDRTSGAVAAGGPRHLPDHLRPPSSAERRHHRDGEHRGVAAQESGPRLDLSGGHDLSRRARPLACHIRTWAPLRPITAVELGFDSPLGTMVDRE